MKIRKAKRRNLVLVGLGLISFVGLMSTPDAVLGDSPCYMENSSGEVIDLEEICRRNEGGLSEEESSVYEPIVRTTPGILLEYGDIVNGVQIVSSNEVVYSNGVRRLHNPDTGLFTFIKPDGVEALPGEEIEIPGEGIAVVESVEEVISRLQQRMQDDFFWSLVTDEEEAELRESLENQLEKLEDIRR